MYAINTLPSGRVYRPIMFSNLHRPYTISIPAGRNSTNHVFFRSRNPRTLLSRPNFAIVSDSRASSSATNGSAGSDNDFVSRVLKENPSQVEPKFQVGGKVYTLQEREKMKRYFDYGAFQVLRRLKQREKVESESSKEVSEADEGAKLEGGNGLGEADNVYLKDILREYRGQLYVPDRIFEPNLSEEDVFDQNFEAFPRMSYDEFTRYSKSDQIKLLSFKEGGLLEGVGFRDFIVELKEQPGDKRLYLTKWAMRVPSEQADELFNSYRGPQYEIETRKTSWVGKMVEYPNPIASSISSRIMVELGMVTAAIAAAAAVIGGFVASLVFAVTSFIFVAAVYVVWPVVKPVLRISLGFMLVILERVWEHVADFAGEMSTLFYDAFTLGGISSALVVLVPTLMILTVMVFLFRFTISRMPRDFKKWDIWQGIRFSQSKAEARVDGSTGVTFADVAGIEEAVEELQELVKYLKTPELFDKLGIKPPHGVLLDGPPGCGKTLVAKAIAGEAGVPFYQMAGSEFVEVLVGVGSARIRDLFKRAKVNKPSVVFIDEIDALATKRQGISEGPSNDLYNAATQERETTLNQLLIELDGFDTGKGVIFLGATNRKDLLDPALLRPGRFDRKIKIRPPNAKGRLAILKVHARKVKLSASVDLSTYANNLPGWTGAKLAQLLQEAALVAARKRHEVIVQSDMDEAVDRLTVGPIRLGMKLGHQGQSRRATVELGTAIISHLLRRLENANIERCDRVSINPRGKNLSQVVFHRLDEESVMFERRPQLLHRLQVFLGGRAAEEVIFGKDTSRASVNYLADASWLARKIVTVWNLENPMVIHGEPPPWRKRTNFVGPKLDFEGSLYNHHSLIERPINFDLDDDVARRSEKLLKDMYQKTRELLGKHHSALLKAVKVLLEHKEISGVEIDYILDKYPPDTPVSLLLEEENPGSLPFFIEEQGLELERATVTASSS
ncbi:hypothetical protein V2J09_004812 [Rumex salicifolius]